MGGVAKAPFRVQSPISEDKQKDSYLPASFIDWGIIRIYKTLVLTYLKHIRTELYGVSEQDFFGGAQHRERTDL